MADYDVLIIGSGFGGSVSALRLTEKGYRVGVLEAGRRFADDEFAKTLGLESLDKLKEAARERLTAEFAGATRQKVKRALLDRLDESHKFEAPPSLVAEEFNLMWNSIKAEMDSTGKTLAVDRL